MLFLTEQWLLVSILIALVVALVFVEGKRGGDTVNFHEMTRLLNGGEALVLDVRDAKEFKGGHITDALNIPHAKLSDRMAELEKHKSKTIIVVDKLGQHAGAAGKLLKESGFVVNRLQGGMGEWQNQNLPVVKG